MEGIMTLTNARKGPRSDRYWSRPRAPLLVNARMVNVPTAAIELYCAEHVRAATLEGKQGEEGGPAQEVIYGDMLGKLCLEDVPDRIRASLSGWQWTVWDIDRRKLDGTVGGHCRL